MLQKFEEDELHVEKVQAARENDLHLMKEKKSIGTQMKQDNVERCFRASEYKRMETLRKIEENDQYVVFCNPLTSHHIMHIAVVMLLSYCYHCFITV